MKPSAFSHLQFLLAGLVPMLSVGCSSDPDANQPPEPVLEPAIEVVVRLNDLSFTLPPEWQPFADPEMLQLRAAYDKSLKRQFQALHQTDESPDVDLQQLVAYRHSGSDTSVVGLSAANPSPDDDIDALLERTKATTDWSVETGQYLNVLRLEQVHVGNRHGVLIEMSKPDNSVSFSINTPGVTGSDPVTQITVIGSAGDSAGYRSVTDAIMVGFDVKTLAEIEARQEASTKRAQQKLNALGYAIGSVDGSVGPQTARAIRSFQTENSLPATGALDRDTQEAIAAYQPEMIAGSDRLPKPPLVHEYGHAVFEPKPDNCRHMDIQIKTVTDGRTGVYFGDQANVFSSGIVHEFHGFTCMPLGKTRYGSQLNGSTNPAPGKGMGINMDRLVSDGPLTYEGESFLVVATEGSVLEVRSTKEDPLRLITTPQGYRYLGGAGTVTGPDAGTQIFP